MQYIVRRDMRQTTPSGVQQKLGLLRTDSEVERGEAIAVHNNQIESDISYFRRRASDERSAAMQARHSEAREAHLKFAERYEDLVRAMAAAEQRLAIGTTDDPPGLRIAVRRFRKPTHDKSVKMS